MQDDLCKSKGSVIESRHFENKGSNQKRKAVRPLADFCRYQLIRPDNSDWNNSKWIFFTIRTGNEFIRMVPNCLTFHLAPQIDDTETLPAVPTYHPLDPLGKDQTGTGSTAVIHGFNRAVYFNPLAGGPATLLSEVEIILDGQRVQINTGGYFSATNTLNKLFCPEHIRRQSLGHEHILHNEFDVGSVFDFYGYGDQTSKLVCKTSAYEYALMELNAKGGSTSDANPRLCPVSGDLDGMLFLSRPKNLGLNSIEECDAGKNQHPLIPPHTEVQIKMRLNDPIEARVIDTKMSQKTFFSDDPISLATAGTEGTGGNAGTAGTAGNPPTKDKFLRGKFCKLHIQDITIGIEKVRAKKEKIQRNMAQGSITFHIDQYLFRARSLQPTTATTNTEFDLPPNIQLCYVFFCRSNQLIFDSLGNRGSDLTRFCLPPKLEHIEFRLDGNRFLFANGLSISREDASSQPDAKQFHDYLRHRNLTDDSFNTFFPKGQKTKKIGFKHVFPIDFTNFAMESPSKLEICCKYDPHSPEDYYCVLFMPQSVEIHKPSRDSIWQTSATVG